MLTQTRLVLEERSSLIRPTRFATTPASVSRTTGEPGSSMRWPADLAFALDEDLFDRGRGSFAHSLLLSPIHRPDMTEILSKMT